LLFSVGRNGAQRFFHATRECGPVPDWLTGQNLSTFGASGFAPRSFLHWLRLNRKRGLHSAEPICQAAPGSDAWLPDAPDCQEDQGKRVPAPRAAAMEFNWTLFRLLQLLMHTWPVVHQASHHSPLHKRIVKPKDVRRSSCRCEHNGMNLCTNAGFWRSLASIECTTAGVRG
jgi:hypothetical protein